MRGWLLLLCLFITCFSLSAQSNQVNLFVFGHSLVDHRPPAIQTPSDETTIAHWIYLLAEKAGHNFAAGGQYGFLPQHANLPPIAQWGYDVVPGVWESDTETFAQSSVNTVLITAGNFMQWQAPNLEYPSDLGITPVSASLDILNWVKSQKSETKCYIYENWPDMAPYLDNDFPPTQDELINYHNYTLGDFHDWWIIYQDLLLAARPDLDVRMIPAGPIISELLKGEMVNSIPVTELYEDDAPHGRASIYFLAGLVTYMVIFEEKAPSNFDVPAIINPTIADNYRNIVDFAWRYLQDFKDENGNSRVFFDSTTSTKSTLTDNEIIITPNPNHGHFQLFGDVSSYRLELLDINGRVLAIFDRQPYIDIEHLNNGVYFLRLQNIRSGKVQIERILKIN